MDRRSLVFLERSGDPRGPLIAGILRRLPVVDLATTSERVARIETFRRRWLSSDEPLVDGSLGEPPEWDRGVSLARATRSSKGPRPASLLYLLTEALGPERVLELGTNLGISAAYVASALAASGSRGRMMTLEASPYRLRQARSLHRELGLENVEHREGLFEDTLSAALTGLQAVDLAFLDGNHRYEPTLRYFERVAEKAGDGAVVVLDDIRLSDGMRHAWQDIRRHSRVAFTVDLYSMAVCFLASTSQRRRRPLVAAIWLALQHRDLPIREVVARALGMPS
jgi:predicted O-methyltransferase YrrM